MKARTIMSVVAMVAVAVGCADSETAGSPVPPDAPVVTTDAGPVRGTSGAGTRVFRGVPYAAPPTGDLRWAPPQPARPWTEVRDAVAPGPFCAQDGLELGRPSEREDCLTLDVTTPTTPGGARPVLVWVHGGSYQDGGATLYGASRMAQRGDVVVVTINYRLGAFGFLTHPALPGAENLGLADQQAALGWVRRNAAAFGGDPEQVTLAGESGGGAAVCAHLASPAADGLFRRAIVQSADCTATWSPDRSSAPRSRAVAEQQGLGAAARLGCIDPATAAACLRAAPVPTVRAASDDGDGVGPVFGTPLLPADPAVAPAPPVPMLLGMNRDEERFRVYGTELANGRATTVEDYRREIERLTGPEAPAVLAEYPCVDDGCAAPTLAAALTDRHYAAGTIALARRMPSFVYEFADPRAPWFRDLPPARFEQGAYHTSELPFLFEAAWADALTPDQERLSDTMIGYWARFAHTGDPNGGGAPAWPAFAGTGSVQRLAPTAVGPGGDFADRHRVAFWSARGN